MTEMADNFNNVDDDPLLVAEASQYQWIRRRIGKDAADRANYGWGVSGSDEDDLSVATKVYGYGVLVSHFEADGKVYHDFDGDLPSKPRSKPGPKSRKRSSNRTSSLKGMKQ